MIAKPWADGIRLDSCEVEGIITALGFRIKVGRRGWEGGDGAGRKK